MLYTVEQELDIRFTQADYDSIDCTLDNLIRVVDFRLNSK